MHETMLCTLQVHNSTQCISPCKMQCASVYEQGIRPPLSDLFVFLTSTTRCSLSWKKTYGFRLIALYFVIFTAPWPFCISESELILQLQEFSRIFLSFIFSNVTSQQLPMLIPMIQDWCGTVPNVLAIWRDRYVNQSISS